jgi:hypothetical protein
MMRQEEPKAKSLRRTSGPFESRIVSVSLQLFGKRGRLGLLNRLLGG